MEEKKQQFNIIHRNLYASDDSRKDGIEWSEVGRKRFGENLLKNLSVASALVICVVALRNGAVPPLRGSLDAIVTTATGDPLLDENLGKLSFVSKLFPEATLVFGEQTDKGFVEPVHDGIVVHAWSENEPYTAWKTEGREVRAVMDGEVTAIYHGNGEERVLQIVADDGYTSLYGNLEQCTPTVGDQVRRGDVVGRLLENAACVLEIKRLGYSVDPVSVLEDGE